MRQAKRIEFYINNGKVEQFRTGKAERLSYDAEDVSNYIYAHNLDVITITETAESIIVWYWKET